MVNTLAIFLAEGRQVYQPCETISGWLALNIDREINLRSLRIELHGLGNVRVRAGRTTYVKNETYLNFLSILLGQGPSQQSGSDVKLQPGNYIYPFQFPLPPHSLPTSFEGSSGSVRYWLDALVDLGPWRSNIQVQKPLFIIEQVMMSDPAELEPRVKRKDRTLGWPCCPAGQLLAKARIDRMAYCPGQKVKVSGYVSNESSKQVVGMEIQLVQHAFYKARQNVTKTSTRKLYEFKNELLRLAPGEETGVEFDSFVIPPVQPTTEGFGCIDISYAIRFKVRVAKAFNTEITFPVLMTAVPFSTEPSHDPVAMQRIHRVLADYLASSHFAAELANRNVEKETEAAGQGSGAATNGPPDVSVEGDERSDTDRPFQYSRMV